MNAYRGHRLVQTLSDGISIQRDGFHIGYARDVAHARSIIDELLA